MLCHLHYVHVRLHAGHVTQFRLLDLTFCLVAQVLSNILRISLTLMAKVVPYAISVFVSSFICMLKFNAYLTCK